MKKIFKVTKAKNSHSFWTPQMKNLTVMRLRIRESLKRVPNSF